MWCCRDKQAPASGFSLIEMVLATALAASLMVAVLLARTRVARGRAGRAVAPDDAARERALLAAIETDLLNARSLELGPEGIVIHGYAGFDAATRTIVSTPVRIVYEVRKAGGRRWLVRRQWRGRRAGRPGPAVVEAELVCDGVERLGLEPVRDAPAGAGQPRAADTQPTDQPAPKPRAVKLTATFSAAGEGGPARSIQRVLHLR